ncbi:hypothetical protein INT47_004115 [Mucor saturninus]|uniref:Uncharacterized protein n=1 Tax=Mucor saturninus TaxID=64648 RepID=A0A8H7R719_9FUNG|nr:hypothetical protein INT47_004115 [Mucor saturninus]
MVDFVKEVVHNQEKQYDHLLQVATEQNSYTMKKSIKEAQAQQLELKRKFDKLEDVPHLPHHHLRHIKWV